MCEEEYLGSRTLCTAIAKVVIDALSRWRTEPDVQIEVWYIGDFQFSRLNRLIMRVPSYPWELHLSVMLGGDYESGWEFIN